MNSEAIVDADASVASALLRYRPGELQTSKTRHSDIFCGLSGAARLDHGRAESAMDLDIKVYQNGKQVDVPDAFTSPPGK